MSKLILIRHGQSEWNELNLFTGWKNPGLTKKGEIKTTQVLPVRFVPFTGKMGQ